MIFQKGFSIRMRTPHLWPKAAILHIIVFWRIRISIYDFIRFTNNHTVVDTKEVPCVSFLMDTHVFILGTILWPRVA